MARRANKASAAQQITRVIGYVRVSTERQANEGVSLDAQKAQLAAYAALYGLTVIETIEDAGESAKTLQRPGLARALAMIESGEAEGLLVCKLDRLTRSVRDLGDLLAGVFSRAALISVGEQIDTRSASGRLVLNVLMSVAQWERETVSERVSAGMQYKRSQNGYTGGGTTRVPYGYSLVDGGALAPVAEEQATIARARELRSQGLPLARVAAALASEGRHARNGRMFFPQQVANMVAA